MRNEQEAEKQCIIDGVRISYREKISDESEPITFFFHGWGSNKESFSLLFPQVKNYIALDFPSHGKSQSPESVYTLDDFVRITNTFFEKIVKKQECSVIVHSFGGRVLLKWLSSHSLQNRFSHITCVGVPFYRDLTFTKKLQIQFSTVLNFPVFSWAKPLAQKIYSKLFPSADYTALQGNQTMKETYQNIVSEEVAEYLAVLQTEKVSFIWGENDDAAPISNMTRAKEVVKNAKTFSVKNAGHFPWVDNFQEFLEGFRHNS